MPLLSQHQSSENVKIILMGDPGTGKTGSLTSLVKAGYWLGIEDYDNGLDSLRAFIDHECPEKLDQVEYRTLRDKYTSGPDGPVVLGQARAYQDGLEMLDRWKYGNTDHGNPATWGPNKVLVIDSLDQQAKCGFEWREQLVLGKAGKYDNRAIYFDTQKRVELLVKKITAESFKTNVILITHIHYTEDEVGIRKGYPKSIGQALSTVIGLYFNSVLLCQTSAGGKRTIQTVSTPQIDLKNPKPFAMSPSYPIGTGLAEIFKVLRAQSEVKPTPTPKIQTLRRV